MSDGTITDYSGATPVPVIKYDFSTNSMIFNNPIVPASGLGGTPTITCANILDLAPTVAAYGYASVVTMNPPITTDPSQNIVATLANNDLIIDYTNLFNNLSLQSSLVGALSGEINTLSGNVATNYTSLSNLITSVSGNLSNNVNALSGNISTLPPTGCGKLTPI